MVSAFLQITNVELCNALILRMESIILYVNNSVQLAYLMEFNVSHKRIVNIIIINIHVHLWVQMDNVHGMDNHVH